MPFDSYRYMTLFLPLAWLCFCAAPKAVRRWVLLATSLVFYAICSGKLIAFLLFAALVAAWAGKVLERIAQKGKIAPEGEDAAGKKARKAATTQRKKQVVAAASLVLIGILIWRKYLPFLLGIANHLFAAVGVGALPLPQFSVPLGLSFFSLMAVSYVVDVYRGTCAAGSYVEVLGYLSFFPLVVEGPFTRFGELSPQLQQAERPGYDDVCFGLQRILWGLCKKVIIADRANMLVNMVFNDYTQYSGKAVIFGTLLYTLQLYADFSGCMDMVLGSAQLFGIRLPENFKQPFFAETIPEFWRRWHITLGAWLRDYLFQPFAMSKFSRELGKKLRGRFGSWAGSTLPVWLGLAVLWLTMGIWHGAGWKYLGYGAYYCVLQILANVWALLRGKRGSQPASALPLRVLAVARTFVLVNVGMLLFRANGLAPALQMLRSIPVAYDGTLLGITEDAMLGVKDLWVLGVGAAVILLVDALHEKGLHLRESIAGLPLPVRWLIYAGGVVVLVIFGAYGTGYAAADFIYAQF